MGVAGVGKTTIGKQLSSHFAVQHLDIDIACEQRMEMSIDEMYESGMRGWEIDDVMMDVYSEILSGEPPMIISATPRILDKTIFWTLSKQLAVTIHIRWKPLKILIRELADVRQVDENLLLLTEEAKKDWYQYYNWRLRHCKRADHEFRLTGNIHDDTESLANFIISVSKPFEKLAQ